MVKIAPSILSADFCRLGEEVKSVEDAGVDMIHVDVMDGCFVPNITVGLPVVESLRKTTKLPLDVHLMILDPLRYVKQFQEAGADVLTIHAEVYEDLKTALKYIKEVGVKPGVSINLATDVSNIKDVLKYVDLVLVMGVEPGFGGQEFKPEVLSKIKKLRKIIDSGHLGAEIEVDGGVNKHTAPEIVKAGADILVTGSAVYRHPKGPKIAINEIRKSI
jgi:ribulose-phosphate 3-epimerase